ncbi:hypothetical protein ACFV27_01140 [Streptomyces antimycoticus]|uniref:hypothetical protein n=1 Tax=Streptomyces antimycoticus TaxID=68175 RepID=UPI0036C04D74
MTATALATLLPDQAINLKHADEHWNALAIVDWGHHVLNALGDRTGAVFEDPVLRHLTWIIPPGAADAWPVGPPLKETLFEALRITLYQEGDDITVPGLTGSRCGTRWIRPPSEDQIFTAADALRGAVEGVVGPLEEAAEKRTVVMCCFCGGATREAEVIGTWGSSNSLRRSAHACKPCWSDIGGSDMHLLGPKEPR